MPPSTDPVAAVSVDAAPFDLPGGRHAALCLHGLTGTPYEVRALGEAVSAAGIRAIGPALPGHNETPQRLSRVAHTEWLAAARDHLRTLRGEHDRVFVIGLSMGGLLSLALASEEPVDGLAVIGTPLKLHHPVARLIPLVKYLRPLAPKSGGSDIRDDAARARHPSYDAMPMASVHELMKLQRIVRAGLGRIRAPIFVGHGAHDATAHPTDAEVILTRVSSAVREHRIYARSGHVVPVDFDGPTLAREVAQFLTDRIEVA